MPRFAANLTMLFNEVDFLARFEAAARAGFSGVEYLFPYAYPADELAKQLKAHKLTQVLHNLPAGNWDKGERGIAILPDRVDEFRAGVKTAISYAKALNCPQVNCLAGLVPDGVDAKVLKETFVDNLKFAASALKAEGITKAGVARDLAIPVDELNNSILGLLSLQAIEGDGDDASDGAPNAEPPRRPELRIVT